MLPIFIDRHSRVVFLAWLVVLVATFVTTVHARAAEYHVANRGNDKTGTGSLTRPLKTINHAFDLANANLEADTILLRRGDTFHEILSHPAPNRIGPDMKPSPDFITFKPYGPGKAPPHWKGTNDFCLEIGPVRFVAEGIRFTGPRGVNPQTTDCEIRRCILDTDHNFSLHAKAGAGFTMTETVLHGQTHIALEPSKGLVYRIDIPRDAWYRLTTEGGPYFTSYQVRIDEDYVFENNGSRVIFLKQGAKEIRFLADYFAQPTRCDLTLVDQPTVAETLTLDRINPSQFLRVGEAIEVRLRTASQVANKLAIVATRSQDGTEVLRKTLEILPGQTIDQMFRLDVHDEGQFNVAVFVDGKAADLDPVRVVVMDPTPLAMPTQYEPMDEGTLVDEIEGASDPSQSGRLYFDSGNSRITASPLGPYREVGIGGPDENSGNRSWFGYQLKFKNPHKPHRVVIDYPDDAFRSFLVMIYERDRAFRQFDNGVACGGPRRLSHKIHQREVIFWPRFEDAWLVVHTWKKNAGAAIQRIRVYELEGDLPPLPVGDSGRYFGMYYEEPRFVDWSHQPSEDPIEYVKTWDRMGSFMRHTGQNLLWYPVHAYNLATAETSLIRSYGATLTANPQLGRATFGGMLLSAEKYGYKIIAEFHQQLPTFEQHLPPGIPIADTRQIDLHGRVASFAASGDSGYNIVHPAVQEVLLEAFGQVAEKHKNSPAFMGIAFRGMQMINPAFSGFASHRFGYGDFTVKLFEEETGIHVPISSDPGDATRFKKRYDFLMGAKRSPWIEWRAQKVTQWYARITEMLRRVRPDLQLFINPKGGGFQRDPGRGMDPSRWKTIPNLRFGTNSFIGYQFAKYPFPMSHTQDIRPWDRVRNRFAHMGTYRIALSPNPYLEGGDLFKLYPPEMLDHFGPASDTCGAPESPAPYYLERFADFMSTGPVWMFADGGLSYRGIDPVQKQEVARFLRSLPMADFQPSPLNLEPAFLWEADSDQQKLFYVVNRQVYPVTLDLSIDGATVAVRLADEKPFEIVSNKLTLSLKPFEMAAFSLDANAMIHEGQTQIPQEEIDRLQRMIRQSYAIVRAAIKRKRQDDNMPALVTEDDKIDAYKQAPLELKAAKKALQAKRYDTADRYVRGSYAFDTQDERGLTLPMVFGAMDQWPDGYFHQ